MTLTGGDDLLLALVFVAVIVLVFVIGKALATWRFTLSPLEWGATCLLMFSLGAFLVAYLWGNGTIELLSAIPPALAFVWWLVRLWRRSSVASSRDAGAEAQ